MNETSPTPQPAVSSAPPTIVDLPALQLVKQIILKDDGRLLYLYDDAPTSVTPEEVQHV